METFSAVARHASFAGAARDLGMSAPAVTRAIAALEDWLGTRLFTRTTRTVALTEAGSRYLADCERILSDVIEAEQTATGMHQNPMGTLSITASVLFGQIYITPIVLDYLQQYPDVDVRLTLLDRVTSLVEEGFDIGVRIGHMPDSSLHAIRVGTVRLVTCASPGYLEAHGVPETPDDLKKHQTVGVMGPYSGAEWRFGKQGETLVSLSPRLMVNTLSASIDAAVADAGIIRALSYQVGPALTEGRLRLVLESYEQEPLPVQLIHGQGTRVSAKIRSFIDFAAKRLRASPILNG